MSTLSLRLPDYLHKKIKEIAKEENISINQFIASAVSEKMAAFTTLEYLESRAKRANDKLQLDPNAKITQGATASDGSDAKKKSKSGVDKSIFSMAEQRDY